MIIEKEVRDYLINKNIAAGHVYMEIPGDDSEGDEYVLIQKTGNGYENFLESPTITIQAISKTSRYNAAVLNEYVKGVMSLLRNHVTDVFRCRLNSDYDFTNTQTKEYRYQSVWELTIKNSGGNE